ncbi:MAG: hypothetical protein HZA25_01185 [Candidatus Niyogibacteria bacterium]|nr:hypothetical protein [Candidatus Niyogibacteria bacterium]
MPNISIYQMQKRITAMPERVRAILFSKDTAQNIETIGRQNRLMIDQLGDLSEIVALAVMGFVSPQNFATELAAKLQLDEKTALAVATEVNTQIFSKIREELQKLDNEPAGAPVAPEPKPYTPPAQPTTGAQQLTIDGKQPILPDRPWAPLRSVGEGASAVPTPIIPKIDTTPFEQKMKEGEIFRAPAQVSMHEAPPAIPRTPLGSPKGLPLETAPKLPPLPTKTEIKYGGKDPYKEPIE